MGIKGYERRWTGTEGIFSTVKRIFGDRVRSKTTDNMRKEAERKFLVHQVIKKYAEEKI